MPRPNPPRDVLAEEYLARRVQLEREQRGWSHEVLARRMTDAGCPINQSGLYKIEQGEPRRRITVDELVGFSRVFGVPVGELIQDPGAILEARVVERFEAYVKAVSSRLTVREHLDAEVSKAHNELASSISDDATRQRLLSLVEGLLPDEPDRWASATNYLSRRVSETTSD